jgi:L-aspartate oxidase
MNAGAANHVLVIGAGIAGASTALRLADAGHPVTVLASTPLAASASAQALGGIAAAIGADDSPRLHYEDTLAAGAGLCQPASVRAVVDQAPASVTWLIAQGVTFDQREGGLDLGQEGAHSRRRVVHVADATGRAIMAALGLRLSRHPGIRLLQDHVAVELLVGSDDARDVGLYCRGARVLDPGRGLLCEIEATHVVLATGGAAGVYEIATNAARPVGDGIALAWRAGCRVADLEMVQFHPTALRHPDAEGWLVTEAVRGEGGRLLLPDGERFMFRYDPRGELAPRDIVARAMHAEMRAHRLQNVLLDISHADPEFVRSHFPNTFSRCAELGIDITREPMPVAPAAHYTCGGVLTGAHGETDISRLYAVGETARTGLHGANRLASNSLLEGLVFSQAASAAILADAPGSVRGEPAPACRRLQAVAPIEPAVRRQVQRLSREIRRVMSQDVGIVRSDAGLAAAVAALERFQQRSDALFALHGPGREMLELRNLACVATLIAKSALLRCESRGAHFNIDHPECGADAVATVMRNERKATIDRPLAVA